MTRRFAWIYFFGGCLQRSERVLHNHLQDVVEQLSTLSLSPLHCIIFTNLIPDYCHDLEAKAGSATIIAASIVIADPATIRSSCIFGQINHRNALAVRLPWSRINFHRIKSIARAACLINAFNAGLCLTDDGCLLGLVTDGQVQPDSDAKSVFVGENCEWAVIIIYDRHYGRQEMAKETNQIFGLLTTWIAIAAWAYRWRWSAPGFGSRDVRRSGICS